MANPCPSCGKGPLHGREPVSPSPSTEEGQVEGQHAAAVEVSAECAACRAASSWSFVLPTLAITAETPPVINPTPEPSRILDLPQWITLFRMISVAAEQQSDKQAARRLRIEAGQCLEEALKFYEPDNDLPPQEAFFQEGSRERLRSHPEQFSRQRLLALRNKLPTESHLRPKSP
jgi:hypothetical protein